MLDRDWCLAARFRLGLRVHADGATSRMASVDGGKVCGAALGPWGDHSVCCQVGPAASCRHGQLSSTLAACGRCAGYAALVEQVVPEFLRLRERSFLGLLAFLWLAERACASVTGVPALGLDADA